MTSPEPNSAYEGRVSGRVSTDTRGAIVMPRHGTCLPGTGIREGIHGYLRSDVHAASRNLLTWDGYPGGYPRIP